jgi:hypothetical protein
MTAEFESNITSVERIKEYCNTEHEVCMQKLKLFYVDFELNY